MRIISNWVNLIYPFLQSTLAYFLAGFIVPYFWPIVATPFGSFAGFVAGLCIIGPLWYAIHFKKLILAVHTKTIVVDMGFAAGFGSLFYGLAKGGSFEASLYILASALCGGFLAGMIL